MGTLRCPKCDNRIDLQTDGTTREVDVAHQGERVHEALEKLRNTIDHELTGVALRLRVVVGGGVIRQAVKEELNILKGQRVIEGYVVDGSNQGALLVQLKKGALERGGGA